MKKLVCLLLLLLLAGCIPIGLKSSSLPFQSFVTPISIQHLLGAIAERRASAS
jgi:hypothetical protein